jgi:hypothetical protein
MEVNTFFLSNVTSKTHSEDVKTSSLNSLQQIHPTFNFSAEKEEEIIKETILCQRPVALEGLDSPVSVINFALFTCSINKMFLSI